MSTIRRKKRGTAFVQIDKSALQDKNLSWKAKGLLAYLLSLPDDWRVYQSEIVNHATDGKDSTGSAFKELIAAGYITKEEAPKKKGKFTGHNYTVSDFPQRVNRDGETGSGKPATTNNDSTNNKKTKGKSENLQTDKFEKVEGLKSKIGPKHYKHLNSICEEEETYLTLKGMYHDGRFDSLMDWLEYKKSARSTYKIAASIQKLVFQFNDYTPREVQSALDKAISNGYQGIFLKKFSDKQPGAARGQFSGLKAQSV